MTLLPHTFLVGGYVRDWLLGITCHDFDMATALLPEESIPLLKKAGYRIIPTGLAHGTITVLLPDKRTIELTTFRKDTRTDGRRATVCFDADIKTDALRRDFTINALYMTPAGQILDFTDGQTDLIRGKIRFIGNAEKRISEDYLRILRFFRFYGRFGKGKPNKEALNACQKHKKGLNFLSTERKKEELFKILSLPHPGKVLTLMKQTGVLDELIFTHSDFYELNGLPPNPLLRLWFLCRDKEQNLRQILKLSKKETDFLQKLTVAVAFPLTTLAQRKEVAYRFGNEIYKACLSLRKKKAHPFKMPVFPITASDIMTLFPLSGPQIGEALKKTETIWIKKNFPSKKQLVLDELRDILNKKESNYEKRIRSFHD